jgi:hypothetical protein
MAYTEVLPKIMRSDKKQGTRNKEKRNKEQETRDKRQETTSKKQNVPQGQKPCRKQMMQEIGVP